MFDPAGTERSAPAVAPDDVAAWRAAAGADLAAVDADDLLATIRDVEATRRALDATAAHLAAEAHARGVTVEDNGLTTPNWLGWELGLRRGESAARVRVGAFLRTHDQLRAALVDGRITFDHAAALQRLATPRVAHVVAEFQQQLVDAARGVRFETWHRNVAALLALADDDGAHDPRPDDHRLTLTDGLDGALHLDGDLTGTEALELRAALDAEADRLFHELARDAATTDGELPVPHRGALLALALVELCRRGRAALHPGSGPVADVTLVLSDDPADGHEPDAEPDDGDGWLHGLVARTLDGAPIPRRTAAVLCCDPRVRALVVDTDGTPLRLGRDQRLASAAQRRTLAVRDGGCCFPGCTAPPSWTDAHHVSWWDHDGPTDVENLGPLCRRHHGVVHRRGWSMRALPRQRFQIITPTGKVLACQRHGRADPPDRTCAPA